MRLFNSSAFFHHLFSFNPCATIDIVSIPEPQGPKIPLEDTPGIDNDENARPTLTEVHRQVSEDASDKGLPMRRSWFLGDQIRTSSGASLNKIIKRLSFENHSTDPIPDYWLRLAQEINPNVSSVDFRQTPKESNSDKGSIDSEVHSFDDEDLRFICLNSYPSSKIV